MTKKSQTVTQQHDKVGGLIGKNFHSRIYNSYAEGSVSGNNLVGGLAGYSFISFISCCYAAGPVSGTDDIVGGLVGSNQLIICASFWDTDTTGQANGIGENLGTVTVEVYGRTTAQMQTQTTFTDVG